MRVEQSRLLNVLDEIDGWVPLFALEDDPYLHPNDDLFVPSLVARGWVDHDALRGVVRVNEAGRAAFERL
ncbi:hypothetical protein M446_1864 [Methylobacterium sp. 4-46]|uniref:hypothetical protein n=1 Tax=unclassified Methylobacterium TaxID=2615210 RepID=UPI000165C9BA|nr:MULTISPECIES: hypothetical protein [Methylobacterium]ACA16346.1 hypothetical protein M446_1864 [Methylobacterium sp. 4-46]WFT82053.1 hypothetical protein QA634_09435 [Methylobacterium nodulans]